MKISKLKSVYLSTEEIKWITACEKWEGGVQADGKE